MNKYFKKDQAKFKECTHLIAVGVVGSSSYFYSKNGIQGLNLATSLATVNGDSIVGISTNGDRPDRKLFPTTVLDYLIGLGCTIITDNLYHRSRPYNIGEREVAEYLANNGYKCRDTTKNGIWRPR